MPQGAEWLVLVVVAFLLWFLVGSMLLRRGPERRTHVADDLPMGGTEADLAARLPSVLAGIRRTDLHRFSDSVFALEILRTPTWGWLAAICTVPLGPFIFLRRFERLVLYVQVIGTDEGPTVRLLGETESAVQDRVVKALAAVAVENVRTTGRAGSPR